MEQTLDALDRADATLALTEGRLPEAQRLLDGLIKRLATPENVGRRHMLCLCLLDRAGVNDSPSRWKEQLRDLDDCAGGRETSSSSSSPHPEQPLRSARFPVCHQGNAGL